MTTPAKPIRFNAYAYGRLVSLVSIFGYCPIVGKPSGPHMTAKAVRITVKEIAGEDAPNCDTTWLPRSIAQNLTVELKRDEREGCCFYEVRAQVPAWWVNKLDQRAGWQKAGYARPPMATRPF